MYLYRLKSHYTNLLNVNFPWDNEFLDKAQPVEGPPVYISEGRVSDVVKKLGFEKATELFGVFIAMATTG